MKAAGDFSQGEWETGWNSMLWGETHCKSRSSLPRTIRLEDDRILDHRRIFRRDLDAEDSMRRYKRAAPTELGTTTIRYSTTGCGATPLSVTNHRWR